MDFHHWCLPFSLNLFPLLKIKIPKNFDGYNHNKLQHRITSIHILKGSKLFLQCRREHNKKRFSFIIFMITFIFLFNEGQNIYALLKAVLESWYLFSPALGSLWKRHGWVIFKIFFLLASALNSSKKARLPAPWLLALGSRF